jgi:hypothetical protein
MLHNPSGDCFDYHLGRCHRYSGSYRCRTTQASASAEYFHSEQQLYIVTGLFARRYVLYTIDTMDTMDITEHVFPDYSKYG